MLDHASKIKVSKEEYGKMILDDIGAMNSKMSLLMQYFYSSIIIEDKLPKISQLFDQIVEIEANHLKILMKLALKLQVDPRLWTYQNDQCSYWSPAYLNYPQHINQILTTLIKQTANEIDKYVNQMTIIDDASIKAILNQMISDEKNNLNCLKKWEAKLAS